MPPTLAVENYAILVLGSGEGGKYLAWAMAKEGRRTAPVELARDQHGGRPAQGRKG